MAKVPDATQSSGHIAIDIDVDGGSGDETSCCPVCLEPPEWVAVGPCGHGELCVDCAVRLRFCHNDRRCCICRRPCPTVVVTRTEQQGTSAAAAAASAAAISLPAPPALICEAGPRRLAVGARYRYYWYHGGVAAYFDDQQQYDEARKACLELKPAPAAPSAAPAPAAAAAAGEESPGGSSVAGFVLDLGRLVAMGASAGSTFAVFIDQRYATVRVILVLAFVVLFVIVGFSTIRRPRTRGVVDEE